MVYIGFPLEIDDFHVLESEAPLQILIVFDAVNRLTFDRRPRDTSRACWTRLTRMDMSDRVFIFGFLGNF